MENKDLEEEGERRRSQGSGQSFRCDPELRRGRLQCRAISCNGREQSQSLSGAGDGLRHGEVQCRRGHSYQVPQDGRGWQMRMADGIIPEATRKMHSSGGEGR